MVKPADLTGETYGQLTVAERGESDRHGKAQWWCICACGRRKLIRAINLKQGDSRSCGECGAYHQTGLDPTAIRFEITIWTAVEEKQKANHSPMCWGQVIDADTRMLVFRTGEPQVRSRYPGEMHPAASRCMVALAQQGLIGSENMRTFKRWCVEERVTVTIKQVGNDDAVKEAWYEVTGEQRPMPEASRAQSAQRIVLPYPDVDTAIIRHAAGDTDE